MTTISATSGHPLSNVTLSSGDSIVFSPGGVAYATTVLGGAVLYDAGSTVGTIVRAGGTEDVTNFGSAIGTTVLSGGTQLVDGFYSYQGRATDTTIDSGGFAAVSGVLSGATVEAGGTLAMRYSLF